MRLLIALLALFTMGWVPGAPAEYPVERPPRPTPPAPESACAIFPGREQQCVAGLGFEIQCDSIGSGNTNLPAAFTSVPHDLTPAERQRLGREMLHGFRYCRLAAGLYWRGLDTRQQCFQERWPGQLSELRHLLQVAGVEGVSLEYWSPAPYWKSNGRLSGQAGPARLRCFGPDFSQDSIYHGDRDRFLRDFAAACGHDLEYLKEHGIPVHFWGLQNEPGASDRLAYSCCGYSPAEYAATFRVVAPVVRAFDPKIQIIADSWQLEHIAPALADPATATLVDAFVVHQVGDDSRNVRPGDRVGVVRGFPEKPRFQNEFEYLGGPASPARCLNTVQNIMNWFQIARAPTWFWIHALKPAGHQEASGYSLGFWRPPEPTNSIAGSDANGLLPGHWIWNPYNWYAVGSFLRHMPWDCRVVQVVEPLPDADLRVLAFKRPNGKLTVVLSNRGFAAHTFHLTTGLPNNTSFQGYRYTPQEAGTDCRGVPIGTLTGGSISPTLADLTWEFWEQQ